MKKSHLILLAFSLFFINAGGQNFYKKFQKELSKKLSPFISKGFIIQDPPMNNFGLATCYLDEATYAKFECDMFNCINKKVPDDFSDWLKMNEFAGVGDTKSAETFSKSIKSQYVSNIILPKVFGLLNIKSSISGAKINQSTLSFGNFYLRLLRKQPFQDFIVSLNDQSRIKKYFYQGRLVITTGDVVIEKMSYEIEVKSDIDIELEAKLKNIKDSPADTSSFKFAITRTGEKTYKIDISKPVIVATLTQIQSGPGIMSADANKEYLIDVLKNYTKPTKL